MLGICIKAHKKQQRFRNCSLCMQLQTFNKPRWYTFHSRSTKKCMHYACSGKFAILFASEKRQRTEKRRKTGFLSSLSSSLSVHAWKYKRRVKLWNSVALPSLSSLYQGAANIFCGFYWHGATEKNQVIPRSISHFTRNFHGIQISFQFSAVNKFLIESILWTGKKTF